MKELRAVLRLRRDNDYNYEITEFIDFINNYRLKGLDKNYEKEIKIDNDFVFNKKTKYTIREGTKVKVLLDTPQNIFGDKLQGKHRKSDIYWSLDNFIIFYIIYNNIPHTYYNNNN